MLCCVGACMHVFILKHVRMIHTMTVQSLCRPRHCFSHTSGCFVPPSTSVERWQDTMSREPFSKRCPLSLDLTNPRPVRTRRRSEERQHWGVLPSRQAASIPTLNLISLCALGITDLITKDMEREREGGNEGGPFQ